MGDPLGAKIARNAIWDASGAPFGCLLGRILGPSWSQDGVMLANLAPDVPKKANLERTWRDLGCILLTFLYLERDLSKNGENRKNDDSSSLLKVF